METESPDSKHSPQAEGVEARARGGLPRLVVFFNGVFANIVGGGDVYFNFMMRAAQEAGYPTHCFGGHALKTNLIKAGIPMQMTLTDSAMANLGDVSRTAGQFRLLGDLFGRYRRTLPHLRSIAPQDIAYSGTDYWFDTIPLIRCRARAKLMYLGMIAPTLGQVVRKARPDVTPIRLPSIYYWMSQHLSLNWFLRCPRGVVAYSHPEMADYLRGFGYGDSQMCYVPNGSDTEIADSVPEQIKKFDVVWTGRVHPQKGIDDLLETLSWLKTRMPDFRGLIIGKSQAILEPLINQLGLAANVSFSGLVSEQEKFRLLKSSRVFVMPSRYESWGIVVGEALVSEIPVVAYKLSCYQPVFGDFVRYVPPFDIAAFKQAVEDEIRNQRAGSNYLATMDVAGMKQRLSWAAAQETFRRLLDKSAADRTKGM